MNGPRACKLLPSNYGDAISSIPDHQAAHIARRFNLSLALAAVVAVNAFQTAEERS